MFWFNVVFSRYWFWFRKSITLSGLLNVLDGVGAGEGRILVATTNYYDRLDEALRRPGRIDLEVKFELATKYQAREQFCQFYVPQITTKETEAGITLVKAESQESDRRKDGEKHFEDKDLNLDDLEFAAKFSRLADQFAEDFQEHLISSASLQQYLLMHKNGPTEAVAKFKAWVEAEVEKRERINQNEGANSRPVPKHEGNGHAASTVLDVWVSIVGSKGIDNRRDREEEEIVFESDTLQFS